ncbi:transmembrane protein, putative (macronuclear) [Tetrahymena thermophila SB210]|uniref:Transmembrane protein, putative n=1 Tax=Tetrahymena thermophila (strain SB210) TaxID=312017 RepID=Q22P55_TETTS|nr:transmembrane protein, putative [Tetrahymena thermophila SB210]EAR86956.2 transmembrane protein, putative [Tetrahymena thermophila SB210]|eukprot:XP_001007201.2 transmembrane protein, putative [Tetrahymena thermophila SB210]
MQNLSTLEYLISNQGKNTSELNIYNVIQFDESISSVAEQELNLMDQKTEFLKCISQDFIELQNLEKTGVKLCSERDELEKKLKQLYKVNPNNEYLNFLISNYLCCLSFDDSREQFLQNLKYQKKPNQKIFQAAFSKNSAVVFISLLKDEFAHIKNVSNSFLLNFQYEKRNILDKNVAILMPKSIGMQHDKIISRYVERGFFEEQKIKDIQPLYAINSKGFLIEIQLNLQISLMGLNQIGVSGLIQVNKSLNEYVVITDVINNNLVQAASTQIYIDLFHPYIEKQEEYKKIFMPQCIPLLPHVIKATMLEFNQRLGDKQDNNNSIQGIAKKAQIIKSKKIETIAFLPKFRKNGISRLFLKPYDLEQMIRNGLFTLNLNDIYIVQFKVQVTIDEFLNVGQLVFKTIKKIEIQEQQIQSINLLFLEQLKQYCPNCNFSQEEIQSLFFMNDWQTQLFSKINQVVDKYSHHHQSLTNLNTIKKQYENQIEEISEEKEEVLNQTDRDTQFISQRNYLNHFDADIQKEDNILSVQRDIGSIDNLMTPKEKHNKPLFSHKQIQIVAQESWIKNFEHQQISSQQHGSKDLRSNETTNILSQTSLQSPKYKESQKLIIHSSRGSKNFDLLPLSMKQITPNYTQSQSLKKMNSKQLSDINEKLEAQNEQKNLSDEVQAVHQQSVSSSRNNQFTSIKKIIKNSFEKPSRSRVFNQILILAVISLIIVGIIIIVFFFNLEHKFDLQTKDFYYIPWGMNIRISISRIFKNHIFEKFTNIPDFGMYNNRNILSPIFNQNKYDQNTYFKDQILEIVQEPMIDLFLLQYITEKNLPVSFYNNNTDFTTLETRVQPALNFYGIYMFQFANYNMNDPNKSDKLIMINLFNNFLVLVKNFANIQSLQEQNIQTNNNQIQSIVLTLLCLICVISLAFVLTIIPTFAYSQLKKQRIFFLFSTIDPQRIKEMHKVILIASQQIIQYKTKSHQKNLSHFGTSQYLKNHQLKESELINKKKKISSSSQYPKYSFSLILKCLIVYIILIVYPVVNYIITNTLTSQSGENQTLQGLIQTAKAQISSNIATFGLCAHSDLNLSNDYDLFPKYQQRFLSVLQQGPTTLSQFQTSIQQQQQKGRFNQQLYTDFFFNIITSDACAVLKNYPQYFNKTILNYQSCTSTYNSVLQSGLLNAINIFSDFFVNAYEIYQINDKQKRYSALVQLIQKNDLFQVNNLYEMIIEFMTGLTKFIVETNDQFFSQMNLVQKILMVYQFIVLAIVYQFGLVKYFKDITFQLKRAKHVLTIFEITYLVENSYILNYLSK